MTRCRSLHTLDTSCACPSLRIVLVSTVRIDIRLLEIGDNALAVTLELGRVLMSASGIRSWNWSRNLTRKREEEDGESLSLSHRPTALPIPVHPSIYMCMYVYDCASMREREGGREKWRSCSRFIDRPRGKSCSRATDYMCAAAAADQALVFSLSPSAR